MDNHEFEDLGKKIQDIVDNAVNSNSYHELSRTINQTVNKAINSGSEALKNALNSVFDPGPMTRTTGRTATLIRILITDRIRRPGNKLRRNRQNFFTERLQVRISKA